MKSENPLTDTWLKGYKAKSARDEVFDTQVKGFGVRVTPTCKSFFYFRRVKGERTRFSLGKYPQTSLSEARKKALDILIAIERDTDPREAFRVRRRHTAVEGLQTFAVVSADWVKRHVEARGLRSQSEIERMIAKYVTPKWKSRTFTTIRRGDITALLDGIEDSSGASQADAVLAVIRGISNWYATRHEDYVSPFVKGMRRTVPAKRERILTDVEIRAIWVEAQAGGRFGAIIQIALLTAQRREKIAEMAWADVENGVWNVPRIGREKGTGGHLVLPPVALRIIEQQARTENHLYVFPGRGRGHFNGFSPCKRTFDKRLPGLDHWTLHDLRRTARSLMSRAGVRSEIAERVMGHAIEGVEGVYDRHSYREEKAEALKRLAALIETINNPSEANVVPLRA